MSQRVKPIPDRISSLPATLLSHILSFLPTKEAVATTVLSKKWKPLWLSVSTLRFHDQTYLENKETYLRFLQLVYTVMLLRDALKPIQRFYLNCMSSLCDSSTVNTWVLTAVQRKVERIGLALPSTVNLPSCILTSTTLVVLKLRGLTVNRVSSFSVSFPSLKTLHLRKVHFPESVTLFEILSACPVLEDLLIRALQFADFFTDRQLKRLLKLVKADISNCCIAIPLVSLCNVEFLRIQARCWSWTTNSEISAFFNLTYMELIIDRHDWNWLIKLLHLCPNLKILVIEKGNPFKETSNEDWLRPKLVPNCLSSQLKRCFLRKYEGGGGELEFARYVMQNAKVLRALTISSDSSKIPEEKLQMIQKLSSCPRISVTCELFFERYSIRLPKYVVVTTQCMLFD